MKYIKLKYILRGHLENPPGEKTKAKITKKTNNLENFKNSPFLNTSWHTHHVQLTSTKLEGMLFFSLINTFMAYFMLTNISVPFM